ncbi:hypothetical protein [Enterobacter dykesii]|uniref:hypothetical protein n=1 Tax=Enterobacter dykesii TaxID=2797506 RepID=UPI0032B3127F
MAADAPAQKSKALDTNAILSSFFIIYPRIKEQRRCSHIHIRGLVGNWMQEDENILGREWQSEFES